ncbi:MAG: serine hydroxymethyltransferase [Candidatus Marsarchaeota archaeon]|nr:serine hydroxymethyltransferase [Candidatus Marsarchaeota archaeon]
MPELLLMLSQSDPEVWNYYKKEWRRQEEGLELIPSENYASMDVMAAAGGIFTNKYAEGYPRKRYYGGNEWIDEVELLAISRACSLFGSPYANVQPHAGSQANMAAYFALLSPGDTVMGLNLSQGGHLTHGSPVTFSGKWYKVVPFNLHPETHLLDYEEIARLAEQHKPKMIIAGFTAYPRQVDFSKFAKIAKASGAKLMADMSHVAGLVAAGEHPSPIGHADVTTSTTHKTLRGPRGAFILSPSEETAKLVDKAVFPGLQGGPLENMIMAKAVAFHEAATPEFKQYAKQIVKNAKALAKALLDLNFTLVSGGTDTHLILIDLRNRSLTGKEAQLALDAAGITGNKNTIPNDPQSPFITSGLRIGTPALTTRGMKEKEMQMVAGWMDEVLKSPSDEGVRSRVKAEIKKMTAEFPIYPGLIKE